MYVSQRYAQIYEFIQLPGKNCIAMSSDMTS